MLERLVQLRSEAPSLKAKGRPVYDYFYKERYLDKEVGNFLIYESQL